MCKVIGSHSHPEAENAFYKHGMVKYNEGKRGRFMKVIFLKDVPNVAKAGQLKDVNEGYARNFLIPKKMAVMATEGALNDFSAKMEARAKSEAQEEAENRRVAGEIEGKEVFIEAKSGGKDRLYGAVTAADIAAALEEATGIAVDKRKIKVSSNIRQVGTYNVDIKLAKDITPVIKVTVKGKPAD